MNRIGISQTERWKPDGNAAERPMRRDTLSDLETKRNKRQPILVIGVHQTCAACAWIRVSGCNIVNRRANTSMWLASVHAAVSPAGVGLLKASRIQIQTAGRQRDLAAQREAGS